MPTGCRSVYLDERQSWKGATRGAPHLLVISNVVPKICARTNSAMLTGGDPWAAAGGCWSERAECEKGVVDGWESRSRFAI